MTIGIANPDHSENPGTFAHCVIALAATIFEIPEKEMCNQSRTEPHVRETHYLTNVMAMS